MTKNISTFEIFWGFSLISLIACLAILFIWVPADANCPLAAGKSATSVQDEPSQLSVRAVLGGPACDPKTKPAVELPAPRQRDVFRWERCWRRGHGERRQRRRRQISILVSSSSFFWGKQLFPGLRKRRKAKELFSSV